jgi:hypothetical protein
VLSRYTEANRTAAAFEGSSSSVAESSAQKTTQNPSLKLPMHCTAQCLVCSADYLISRLHKREPAV